MKSLRTLIKLQKNHVDEQRQILSRLQAHLDSVLAAIENLKRQWEIERQTAVRSPEAGMTYGAFVQVAIERSKELEKNRISAEKAVEIARDRLAVLFEEQKRYETALANRMEEEKREQKRIERIDMDEIGSVGFSRQQEEDGIT